MTITLGTLATIIIVAGALAWAFGQLKGSILSFLKITWAVICSPVKGFAAVKAARLEGKIKKSERKLAKRVMKLDKKARLNAALSNGNYLEKEAELVGKIKNLKEKRK